MFSVSAIALSAVLFVGADPAPAFKPLQGAWIGDRLTADGKEAPAKDAQDFSFAIMGDKAIPSRDPKDVATLTVDDTKNPKEINFTDLKNNVNKGIYRLKDADTLEFCMNLDSKGDRPKEFSAPTGSTHLLVVMKRKK